MQAAITNKPRPGFCIFDTAIGRCALLWRGDLIVGAALPETSDEAMRERLTRRFPGAVETEPPEFVREAMGKVVALLAGEDADLGDVPLDLEGSDFELQVWQAARRIPRGEVRSYGEVAQEIGAPGAALAVGVALGRNPAPILVPCHRVLGSGGKSGGFSAPGGVDTKFRMLEIEGARRPGDAGLFETLPLAVRSLR